MLSELPLGFEQGLFRIEGLHDGLPFAGDGGDLPSMV
jgi:hypothetical protein